jgi:phosphatidylglycerophosphatase A
VHFGAQNVSTRPQLCKGYWRNSAVFGRKSPNFWGLSGAIFTVILTRRRKNRTLEEIISKNGTNNGGLRWWHPARLAATWFGAGDLPKAPGTWGSAVALPFAWLIHWAGGVPALAVATVLVFGVGIWASAVYAAQSGTSDPGPVVIDEVAGQWLTLLVVPRDPLLYALGFVFFRAFDILKPWPISWADKRVKGGLGIMLDDVIAAAFAAILLFAVTVALRVN